MIFKIQQITKSEAINADLSLYKLMRLIILQCPVTCGKGMKHRQVWCQLNDEQLRDDFCNPNGRPESITPCELHECASWQVGPWGSVSTQGFLASCCLVWTISDHKTIPYIYFNWILSSYFS